jgi:hypothetical protein
VTPEIIHWIDSCHHGSGWVARDSIDTAGAACTSFGYILHEDEHFVTVAGHIADDEVAGAMTIPKCAIIGRTQLHIPKH